MSLTLFGQDVIKSISFDEGEILRNIQELHCPGWFELDPCYSFGRFYEAFGIPQPRLKYDIEPSGPGVIKSDACNLPLNEKSISSILFDPPFLATSGPVYDDRENESNIITHRFSAFKTMQELWDWYEKCLSEFYRILEIDGQLVIKCQDTVSSSNQWFSHVFLINEAEKRGFYCKDLFILLAKSRIIGDNHAIQQHARKFHSYYLVFIKTN